MEGLLFIFCMLIVGAIAYGVIQTIETSKKKSELSAAISVVPHFSAKDYFVGVDGKTSIAINGDHSKLCLTSDPKHYSPILIEAERVISAEIAEDGSSVTQTSRTSQVGGALVGGLVFGGVGALVGGLSGKTATRSKVKKIELLLTLDDHETPIYSICFLNMEVSTDFPMYKDAMSKARHWLAIIDGMIHRAGKLTAPAVAQPVSKSVADELAKLADLHARGILSDQEFQSQKNRLLGNNGH